MTSKRAAGRVWEILGPAVVGAVSVFCAHFVFTVLGALPG